MFTATMSLPGLTSIFDAYTLSPTWNRCVVCVFPNLPCRDRFPSRECHWECARFHLRIWWRERWCRNRARPEFRPFEWPAPCLPRSPNNRWCPIPSSPACTGRRAAPEEKLVRLARRHATTRRRQRKRWRTIAGITLINFCKSDPWLEFSSQDLPRPTRITLVTESSRRILIEKRKTGSATQWATPVWHLQNPLCANQPADLLRAAAAR